MSGLDTNVLVRYLTQDDRAQSAKAGDFIERSIRRGDRCHLSHIVLCELVWVLRGAYGYGKDEISLALDGIVEASQFSIEDRASVLKALVDYRSGTGDFSDCLLGVVNRRDGCRSTATLDRELRRNPLFEVI